MVTANFTKRRNSRFKKKNRKIKLPKKCWKRYRRILKTSWKVQTKEFFENSTLHGVKFIAEDGRPFFEKFMWFICVMAGLITSIIIIFSLWEKFQTNPTITGLDTDFHNWDVAFPSITICQEQPGNSTLIDEFIESKMAEVGEKDQLHTFLKLLTTVSYDNMKQLGQYSKLNFSFPAKSIKHILFPLMNNCEDILDNCEWKSKPYDCCEGFLPVFTENGFCYSFNSRHYEEEHTKKNGDSSQFQVHYIKETDPKWSLAFTVKNTEIRIPIYILNSDEMPGIDMKPQHIWDFTMKSISFSVKQTYTTDDTKQLSIKQRRCIFPDERKLETDHIYTYTACARECRMDTSMKLCGCVPFFYNIKSGSSYRYCNIRELECVANNKDKIIDVENCDCQLGCSNTVYEVEKLSANE